MSGRLVDQEDRPVAWARLIVRQGDRAVRDCYTDAGGRFSLVLARDGSFSLSFEGEQRPPGEPNSAEGHTSALRAFQGGLTPGAPDIVVRCEPTPHEATVVVRVVDNSGVPVSRAIVLCHSAVGEVPTQHATGVDGRVKIRNLPDQRIALSVASHLRDKLGSLPVHAMPRGQEITLIAEDHILVEGTAQFHSGTYPTGGDAVLVLGEQRVASDRLRGGRFALAVPARMGGPFRVLVVGADDVGEFEGQKENVYSGAKDVRVELRRRP